MPWSAQCRACWPMHWPTLPVSPPTRKDWPDGSPPGSSGSWASGGAERAASEPASPRELLLAVVAQHPAGRSPGLPPDALRALTGLPLALLGETVSALVRSGDLVRDAWLVRVAESGDLLPHPRLPAEDASGETDHSETERRAIGDRRRLGERRLYERRH
jgi:hypothetical protein